MFHPRILEEKGGQTLAGLSSRVLSGSLLRTGILPMYILENRDQKGLDISGLSASSGQVAPKPVPYIDKEETDEMYLSLKQWIFEGGQNRPKLNEKEVNIFDYADHIINGFNKMYKLLIKYRNELLKANGPIVRFARDVVRVIIRPTRTYAKLLFESYHPDFLQNALNREQIFDHLWVGVIDVPKLIKIIEYEHYDLYKGDIPVFTTHPTSHAIKSSSGQIVEHFVEETGMTRVKKRINDLHENQIERHNWFIKASLVTLTDVDHNMVPIVKPIKNKKNVLNNGVLYNQLLTAGCDIGDHLINIALDEDESLNWLSLSPRGEIGDRWVITPLGVDLYSGISGVILFYAYLAIITHNDRYKYACFSALRILRRSLSELKLRPELLNIGAFTGWGGIIYVLSHLGYIWNDADSICEAKIIAELLPSLIDNDKRYDVIAGSAGCIGALLALYKCTLSRRILEIACMCGNRIVNNAKEMKRGVGWIIDSFSDQPLSGFSHGAAGIAYSLLELYKMSNDELFLDFAKKAIDYERTLYRDEFKNWIDLRRGYLADNSDRPIEPLVQNAWCHGAPGIGMSRLKAYKYLPENDILSEINIALESTAKFGFGGYNHSLCHGVLGNLELFLQAREILGTMYNSEVTKIAVTILDSIDKNGWQCATPLGVETPSFMVGLSGIGYQLLRIAEPRIIPSVLMLEPPI